MKKLFILTVLFSAHLASAAIDEANAQLTAAQKDHQNKLADAKHGEMQIAHLHRLAQQNPTPENVEALKAAIGRHGETVDHCKMCVHGLQAALRDVNAKGHYVQGDAFRGKIGMAA